MIKIIPYRRGSRSVRALALSLGVRRLRANPLESRWIGRRRDTAINWGSTSLGWRCLQGQARILNHPTQVAVASDKLRFFEHMRGRGGVIPHTTDGAVADRWVQEGHTVVARTLLRSHSGRGIELFTPTCGQRPSSSGAHLYTLYVKKIQEYRIHVGRDVGGVYVLFQQRKARRIDTADEEVNWQIRNHSNGFIFAHEDVEAPPQVLEAAVQCVYLLGLDFGAVDVGWNERSESASVYEVNTAPGLEGRTLEVYTDYFNQYI